MTSQPLTDDEIANAARVADHLIEAQQRSDVEFGLMTHGLLATITADRERIAELETDNEEMEREIIACASGVREQEREARISRLEEGIRKYIEYQMAGARPGEWSYTLDDLRSLLSGGTR